jgi:hypothetical protein
MSICPWDMAQSQLRMAHHSLTNRVKVIRGIVQGLVSMALKQALVNIHEFYDENCATRY